MGKRKTAFYFAPSSARKFSSRERRLGTRQNKGYSNSLMISIPTELFYLGVIPSVANFLLDLHNSSDHILRLSTIAFCLPPSRFQVVARTYQANYDVFLLSANETMQDSQLEKLSTVFGSRSNVSIVRSIFLLQAYVAHQESGPLFSFFRLFLKPCNLRLPRDFGKCWKENLLKPMRHMFTIFNFMYLKQNYVCTRYKIESRLSYLEFDVLL